MQVRIHPSSINSQLSVPDSSSADSQDCAIILFEEITRGEAQLYVRQCTLASPHALLLVAAHLALSQEHIQHDNPTGLPFVHLHEHCALAVLLAADCVYIHLLHRIALFCWQRQRGLRQQWSADMHCCTAHQSSKH